MPGTSDIALLILCLNAGACLFILVAIKFIDIGNLI